VPFHGGGNAGYRLAATTTCSSIRVERLWRGVTLKKNRAPLRTPGGTVEFLNSDRLLHNLHSVGKENPPFNRTQPRGRAIPIAFAKPEIIRVDCDLHSWMRVHCRVKPFKARIASLVPGDAFKHCDLSSSAQLLYDELTGQFAAFKIVGAFFDASSGDVLTFFFKPLVQLLKLVFVVVFIQTK